MGNIMLPRETSGSPKSFHHLSFGTNLSGPSVTRQWFPHYRRRAEVVHCAHHVIRMPATCGYQWYTLLQPGMGRRDELYLHLSGMINQLSAQEGWRIAATPESPMPEGRAPTQGPSKAKLSRERLLCFLPGLAFVLVCVCLSSCRGPGSPGRVDPVSVCLSFVACPLLLSGCVSPCGRRPEDQHCF